MREWLSDVTARVVAKVPPKVRDTARLRAFGLLNIPLVFWVSPVVEELSARRCEVRVPLCWRTRNHLGSMYFGVLATGADITAGLIAFDLGSRSRPRVDIVFRDFRAQFVRRPTSDVTFACEDGGAIRDAILDAAETGTRRNLGVRVTATTAGRDGREEVARFEMTLSLKTRASRA